MNVQNKQVCLLEPDEAVRTALTASLEQNGWNVSRDERAGDLSTWLEQKDPVALIAESTLSDITAKRVLRVSRKMGIPVIFLGHGRELEQAVNLMRKGAIDFFEKPFDQQRLLNLLETLIVTKPV